MLEPTVARWKHRVEGVLNDGRKERDIELIVRDVLGQNEIAGRLIERVANHLVGTCVARWDILNLSMAPEGGCRCDE